MSTRTYFKIHRILVKVGKCEIPTYFYYGLLKSVRVFFLKVSNLLLYVNIRLKISSEHMPEMLPDRNIGQRRFTIEIGEISLFSTFFIIIINYHHPQVLHYLPKNKYSHFSRDTTFIRRCLCLETCRMIVLIPNIG